MADTIESLRAEVETLRETVRQYQAALRSPIAMPRSWALSDQESKFLLTLYAAGTGLVTRERMYLAVWGVDGEQDPYHLHNCLFRVRRRLEAANVPIVINVVWRRGWCLEADSLVLLRQAIEAENHVERAERPVCVPDKTVRVPRDLPVRHVLGGFSRIRARPSPR